MYPITVAIRVFSKCVAQNTGPIGDLQNNTDANTYKREKGEFPHTMRKLHLLDPSPQCLEMNQQKQ